MQDYYHIKHIQHGLSKVIGQDPQLKPLSLSAIYKQMSVLEIKPDTSGRYSYQSVKKLYQWNRWKEEHPETTIKQFLAEVYVHLQTQQEGF